MDAIDFVTAFTRIGFSNAAADKLIEMGFNDVDNLRYLSDADVKQLCATLRKPGGAIPNPVIDGALMTDPGIVVSPLAERNLSLAAFWLKHLVRVSRLPVLTMATEEALKGWIERKRYEQDWTAPTEDKPKIDTKDWYRTLENFRNYLSRYPGATKIPLAYVVRDKVEVEPEDHDLSEDYQSVEQEMIYRAPHGTETYARDNTKVHQLLRSICEANKEAITTIRPAESTLDGRKAYFLLFQRYQGKNASLSLSNQAENILSSLKYYGESRRYTFDRFVEESKTQHQLLESLEVQGLHKGIDETSKVRHLLNGIATNKQLESVKTQIYSSPNLMEDFEACIRLAQDVLNATKPVPGARTQQLNISAVGTGSEIIEDRYYSAEEYRSLTADQKKALHELRDKRGNTKRGRGGGGRGGGGRGGHGNSGRGGGYKRPKFDEDTKVAPKTIKKLRKATKRIAALKAELTKHDPQGISKDSDTSSDDDTPKKKSSKNAKHPALTRQGK
jgi:uncharacterized membrane protein YgcG